MKLYILGVRVMKKFSSKKIAGLSVLTAISVLLGFLSFPVLPMVKFLEYDFADVPIFIATFMYGPMSGLLVTAITSIIQGITVSASSGIIGITMHFIATGAYVLVGGNIYKRHKTFKTAIIALVSGATTAILFMIPLNLLLTPLFVGPIESYTNNTKMIFNNLLVYIIAFNVIKFFGNSLVTLVLYKRTKNLFTKIGDFSDKKQKSSIQENNNIPNNDN